MPKTGAMNEKLPRSAKVVDYISIHTAKRTEGRFEGYCPCCTDISTFFKQNKGLGNTSLLEECESASVKLQ